MKLTVLAFGAALAFAGLPQLALAAKSDAVIVVSDLNPPQIAEYVAGVEVRLGRGKYDVLKPKDRAWIVAELAHMKTKLAENEKIPDTKNLQLAFSEFETGLIGLEEGGIVCEKSSRTGSRMVERRCMTRKRQAEIREQSRESMRNLVRIAPLPSGG
mgnify:CR=1 FL=1